MLQRSLTFALTETWDLGLMLEVQLGRRAIYSLMGAGAYGNSVMNSLVSFHMWKTFALPRMLYGLEISKLRHSDTVQLEALQRSVLHDCSVSQIALQMLLYTVYWVFALLSRRSTSENFICSYPPYIKITPSSLSLQRDKWQSRPVMVIAGSFTVINCFINTISRIYMYTI